MDENNDLNEAPVKLKAPEEAKGADYENESKTPDGAAENAAQDNVAQGNAEGVLQARDEIDDVQAVQFQIFEYAFFRCQDGRVQLEFVNKNLVNMFNKYFACHLQGDV